MAQYLECLSKLNCSWKKIFRISAVVVSLLHAVVEILCVLYYLGVVLNRGPYPRSDLGYKENDGELFLLLIFSIQASLSFGVSFSLIQDDRRFLRGVLVCQYIVGWIHFLLLAVLANVLMGDTAEQIEVHICAELTSAILNWYSFAVVFGYVGYLERKEAGTAGVRKTLGV